MAIELKKLGRHFKVNYSKRVGKTEIRIIEIRGRIKKTSVYRISEKET